MIDYETYKRKFGKKVKGEHHVSISQDIFDMLSSEGKFGIAFENEINLAIMEDVLINISKAMMTDDKNNDLSAWKKIGELIKKVLVKHKDDDNALNDRYYEVSASPDERTFFADNPISKNNMTLKVVDALSELGMFYRAMSTNVGEAVCKEIVKAKKKAISDIYDANHKNGTSVYYNKLNFIISTWGRRIGAYESYSNNLKFINRGIKNVGRK